MPRTNTVGNEAAPAATSLSVIEKKAAGMMGQVQAFVVANQEDLAAASDVIADVKKLAKHIEGEKEKFTAPAKAIIASAKEKYDPYLAKCKEAETILKGKAQAFMLDERRREEAERAKIVKKVETGYMKPETAMTKLSTVPTAPKAAATESSRLTMRMRKDVEIVDQTLIPEEYYKPRELDMAKLRKVVTAGVSVPGTRMIEVPDMSSRA